MAERLIFISSEKDDQPYCKEELVNFTYFSGFAVSQKQKSIRSLHENAKDKYPDYNLLEISTKSEKALGVRLSAFNLKYRDGVGVYPLENVFQASKVYEKGGPYIDLLRVQPQDAKRDTRHHTSGALKCFKLGEWTCELEPKTMFYDWIYCKALSDDKRLTEEIKESDYNAFTDIEFNQNKSINCQARSVAIFVSLCRRGLLEEYLEDKDKWKTIYKKKTEPITEQIRFEFQL